MAVDPRLKTIVQRMIDAGEPEENIASVIRSYKTTPPVSPNDQLKAANRRPLREPTTYTGGVLRSAQDTIGKTAKGVGESVLSMVDPRTYLESLRRAALMLSDPAQAAVDSAQAGSALVDEGRRVIGGDPEAGGRAIGQLGMGLVAPRLASSAPAVATRAAEVASRVPVPSAANMLTALKMLRHPLLEGGKVIADQIIKRSDGRGATSPVETASGGVPLPTGPLPSEVPPVPRAAGGKSPQQVLNEEALARRRAAVRTRSQEPQAPTADPKPSMTAQESKLYLDLRAAGKSDQQARQTIEASRMINALFDLKTPTKAETRFPKGMRGKATPPE
jgi:hypothetical protein